MEPLCFAQGAFQESPEPSVYSQQGIRVLIVDDEETNLRLLTKIFTRYGYQIRTACDGEEALQLVEEETPDIVLLDLSMPRMDGLTTCRRLRSHFHTRGLPIIMVTARGSTADKILGFRAGADDYVVKPFDVEELKARIEGTLARRHWDLYRHPLTGLPGSLAIEEEVSRRIRLEEAWAFAYVDIDNFKAYNDSYGYEAGDSIIRWVAKLLLQESLDKEAMGSCFPGHVGGDDFVFIGPIHFLKQKIPHFLAEFDGERKRFYNLNDIEQGGILTKDRQGIERRFPFVSLTVAVVSTDTRRIAHYGRMIQIASELKSYAKRQDHQGKSLMLWDRRRDA